MPRLLLVRHADAGDRGAWVGEDRDRPLSLRGRAQARVLADQLAPLLTASLPTDERHQSLKGRAPASVRIRSSPAERCRATVAPLATVLGATVVHDTALVEGSPAAPLLARLDLLEGPEVWASHGDVIPALLLILAGRGVDLGHDPRCRKASTWVLEVSDATVTQARYLRPPD
jgi:8-oxo-(d)GTP phosphatase